jgi:HSP20 family molecular chaperone IbpA
MALVAIEKFKGTESIPQALLEQIQSITETVRQRAFDLFRTRDGGSGSDLDDWLQAERDVACVPPAELVERDGRFQARTALPGFDPKEVRVSAMPDALIIEAESSHTRKGKNDGVRFCEFSGKKLFRRLELPAAIDVDSVTASLDKGILQVTASKAAPKRLTLAA